MNERSEKLEAELSSLRPGALPPELLDRIGSALKRPQAWPVHGSDRLLIGAICSGALAACVILSVSLGALAPSSRPIGSVQSMTSPNVPRLGDASLALARADAAPELLIRW